MAEKKWFKDFPTEIKNGTVSDDYLEHKLRLMNFEDIEIDIAEEAALYKALELKFYVEGGKVENKDLTYTFRLRDTTIIVTFDEWMNARRVRYDFDIQDRELTHDAKIITDFIRAIVRENAPDGAAKEVVTMWKDVDNRHVVRGTDIAIQRIKEVPTMMSIALGGVQIEDSEDLDP